MKYAWLLFFFSINASVFAQGQQSAPPVALLNNPSLDYPTPHMIKISRKKLPDELKFTLTNVSYVGWEKGIVYLDTLTKDYALLLPDKYKTFNAKAAPSTFADYSTWHCFTNEGKPFPCSVNKIN